MANSQAPRDTDGRFAPGNPGGPGRPARPIERDYLRALGDACPPDAWRAIVERAVADATNGDAKAREWLAAYLIGQPEQGAASLLSVAVDEELNVDRVEIGALKLRECMELERMSSLFGPMRG